MTLEDMIEDGICVKLGIMHTGLRSRCGHAVKEGILEAVDVTGKELKWRDSNRFKKTIRAYRVITK